MFCIALVAVLVLEYFEKTSLKYLIAFALSSLPTASAEIATGLIPKVFIQKDAYFTLLSTVAGMSGVFLGLYFTALSVVAQGLFQDVPGIIRDLLVREKVGNVYVRTLALLTSISLVLLGYMSMGGQPGVLSSISIVLLSCYGVLSFVVLGIRVFYFFDIAKLAPPVFDDLAKSVHLATVEGYGWQDPSFQITYKNEAVQHLESIRTISEWCFKRLQSESQPLKTIVRLILQFIEHYKGERRRIPSNSKWYIRTPRYQNWFTADSSRLIFALQSQTGLQPEYVPKWDWLEKALTEIYGRALSHTISTGHLSETQDLVRYGTHLIGALGSTLDSKDAGLIFDLIFDQVSIHLQDLKPENTNILAEEEESELALLDLLGYQSVYLSLQMVDALIVGSAEKGITERVRRTKWSDRNSIYKGSYPPPMLAMCESIHSKLWMELRSEGHQISPLWYIQQLVIMEYCNLCRSALELVSRILSEVYIDWTQKLFDHQHCVFVSQHASRGLELCDKMTFRLNGLEKAEEQLSKYHVLKDLNWPNWNLQAFRKMLIDTRAKLIILSANCLPVLGIIKRGENVPDYFGQAYNTVYAEAHYMLQKNNSEQFEEVFPPLFLSAFQAFGILKDDPLLQKQEPITKIGYTTEPIVDLLELSGYAKIYSELHQNPLIWESCAKQWEKYFSGNLKGNEVMKYLITVSDVRRNALRLFSRDVLRGNWERHLRTELRQRGLVDDIGLQGLYEKNRRKFDILVPFIRTICREVV